jgi:hypothetical protein
LLGLAWTAILFILPAWMGWQVHASTPSFYCWDKVSLTFSWQYWDQTQGLTHARWTFNHWTISPAGIYTNFLPQQISTFRGARL